MLLLPVFISGVFGFPSYQDQLPNASRIPCPAGAEGCSIGVTELGQPPLVCGGVGHATCAGGSLPLNAFGEAFRDNGFRWNTFICSADSDGDGYTNGQELGDPCCEWAVHDLPSEWMAGFMPSHPGVADSAPAADTVWPTCGSAETEPAFRSPPVAAFAPGEEQHSLELRIENLVLPAERTTYVDVGWNLNLPGTHDVFHIVFGEALVHLPDHLHHFVVTGCSSQFPPEQHGRVLEGGAPQTCQIPVGGFSGWAPGATLWPNPIDAGVPIGPGAGIVAISVNVHFTDADRFPAGSVVSQDGIRVHFTPDLRPRTIRSTPLINLFVHSKLSIPPGNKRFFITRRCTVGVDAMCQDTDDDDARRITQRTAGVELTCSAMAASCAVPGTLGDGIRSLCPRTCGTCERMSAKTPIPILASSYHAHLLGREMYHTLTRDGVTADLGSEPAWHYDDQGPTFALGKNWTVKQGDVLQTTCVYDSRDRTTATPIGLETVDEMCLNTLSTIHDTDADVGPLAFRCDGHAWTGVMEDGESALDIARRAEPPVEEGRTYDTLWSGSVRGLVDSPCQSFKIDGECTSASDCMYRGCGTGAGVDVTASCYEGVCYHGWAHDACTGKERGHDVGALDDGRASWCWDGARSALCPPDTDSELSGGWEEDAFCCAPPARAGCKTGFSLVASERTCSRDGLSFSFACVPAIDDGEYEDLGDSPGTGSSTYTILSAFVGVAGAGVVFAAAYLGSSGCRGRGGKAAVVKEASNPPEVTTLAEA